MHFNVDQPSIVWTKEIHGILLVSVVISWTRPCSFFFERCDAFRLDGGSSFSLKWNGIWWVYPVDHIFGEITWNRNIFTSIFEDPSMIISSPCWADVGTGFFFKNTKSCLSDQVQGYPRGFGFRTQWYTPFYHSGVTINHTRFHPEEISGSWLHK